MKIKVTKQFIHHPIRSRGSPTGTRAFTNTPELVYHRLNKRLAAHEPDTEWHTPRSDHLSRPCCQQGIFPMKTWRCRDIDRIDIRPTDHSVTRFYPTYSTRDRLLL